MKRLILSLLALPLLAAAQTTLPTSWSFVNPSPGGASASTPTGPATTYTDKLGWSTKLDASISGTTPFVYATGSDGTAACRLDGQNEYVQIDFAEKPGTLTYSIRGTAISPNPPFAGSFKIQASVDGTTWTDLKEYTSMGGAFARDSVSMPASARYARFFYNTKVSGSNVALDNIILDKPAPGNLPTIQVKVGSTALANGVTYINGTAASTVFTIQNLGLLNPLNISSIDLTGDESADYSISNAPTTVAASSSANFTLNYAPASLGSSKATMTINSNDADNTTFVIDLYGISGTAATEPLEQPTGLVFSNVKAYTFNVSYTPPSQKPEAYIILRKKGSPITDAPVDKTSYKRGDNIGASQVAYIGTDTTIKPSYIVANTTYYFKVFAFNGPAGYENYLTTSPLSGSTTSLSGDAGSYYNGMNSTASNFVSALSAKVAPHDTVFYGNYTATIINNFYTRDTVGGKKVVNCVYTDIPYIYDEPFIWWGNSTGGTLTREHTYAQSWMPTRSTPTWPNGANGREFQEYNDLHHLFPADQIAGNNVRSNYPLGVVVTLTSQNGMGKFGKDANGNTVYEPKDSHKGDAARAMFYMCIAYNGIGGNNWSLGAITAAQQNDSVLKRWHFEDLPDAHEIARNEYIASLQHNRNPFIDSINYVCRINFNNLSWISNPGNCGVTVPSLTLTSPVGGEEFRVTSPGTQGVIEWSSSLVYSVKVELYVEDTLNRVVGTYPSVDGSNNITFGGPWITTNKAQIKLTSTNPNLTSMSPYFSIVNAVGLNESALQPNAVILYPNPSKGLVSLSLSQTDAIANRLVVTDLAGREVLSRDITNNQASFELGRSGLYFVTLHTNKGTVVKKLIVE